MSSILYSDMFFSSITIGSTLVKSLFSLSSSIKVCFIIKFWKLYLFQLSPFYKASHTKGHPLIRSDFRCTAIFKLLLNSPRKEKPHLLYSHLFIAKGVVLYEWVSDCFLKVKWAFFSYIMARTTFWWDDNDVRFVLGQHA